MSGLGPAAFAGRPLFEPYTDALLASGCRLPSRDALDDLLGRPGPRPCLQDGTRIHLVGETPALGYEAGIAVSGGVPTREYDWHDYFNALVWRRFPQAKAALNAAHIAALQQRGPHAPRGRRRDALTQFDECGVVVSSSDPTLLAALRGHEWRELFFDARNAWGRAIEVTVFGHATLDQMRAPFVGLCGKALLQRVPHDWFERPAAQRCQALDQWLSAQIADEGGIGGGVRLQPMPLLGIPGVAAENAHADYYADTRQFRPLRAAVAPA
ncbi:DUF3025 domain-containing protein [Niveibacterium sp. COAC-50]|uniref:DUF3025 domain-containing protein n=1 Tax=Niveibacterium sp. COAC-50 TaxID=2729384 RepID=UPI0015555474